MEPDRLHGCNRLQTALATEKSLNGNGKSPPVARLHGFSGETGRACAGPGAETFPPVCVHCGTPATADTPVQIYAIDGEEYPLHRDCQTDWLKEENQ